MAIILPSTIVYNSSLETVEDYLNRLYELFKHDFFSNSVTFMGKRVLLQRDPIINDKVYTFNHLTKIDVNSTSSIDYNRSKKIPWIATILNSCPNPDVKCWEFKMKYKKKTVTRIKVWYPNFSYLIILQKNKEVYYLITAFTKANPNDHQKLLLEFQNSNQI